MYRRDYILRLIERFGHILRALRDRILRREITMEEFHREIHEIAGEAGLDLELARQLDPRMLLMWLSPTGDIDEPKFWLMAELLYLEGMNAGGTGPDGAGREDLARARAIYGRLPADWRPSANFPSAGERYDEISRLLG